MNFPVIDLHCDTVLALLGDDMNQAGSLRKNRFHIDLERASRLGGYAQCFACFTTPFMEKYHHVSPVVAFEREIATLQREIDKNKDLISIAYSPKEIEENRKNGKMSAILTLEGTAGIGKIAVELRANPRFKNIRICGGNTLNCDEALPWYNYLKEQLDEGNTHQLAGEFNGYAAFYETVRKDGKMAMNDEMHNVMEAMVGLEYGLQTGIWWGSAEYARAIVQRSSTVSQKLQRRIT